MKETNKQRQKERITQQDAKHQSEVVILTRVSKRIQFDSLLGNSSKITTGKYSCHFLWLSSGLFSGESKRKLLVKGQTMYV